MRSEFLDDFAAGKSDGKQPAPPPAPVAAAEKTTAAPAPSASVEDDDALLDEELAKELEKGMASFFGGLEGSVSGSPTDQRPARHIPC